MNFHTHSLSSYVEDLTAMICDYDKNKCPECTNNDLWNHFIQLSKEIGCNVIYEDLGFSRADAKSNTVWVKNPTNQLDYIISLHELGHIKNKHTREIHVQNTVKCEIDAWKYALEKSIVQINQEILIKIFDVMLFSYVEFSYVESKLGKINYNVQEYVQFRQEYLPSQPIPILTHV